MIFCCSTLKLPPSPRPYQLQRCLQVFHHWLPLHGQLLAALDEGRCKLGAAAAAAEVAQQPGHRSRPPQEDWGCGVCVQDKRGRAYLVVETSVIQDANFAGRMQGCQEGTGGCESEGNWNRTAIRERLSTVDSHSRDVIGEVRRTGIQLNEGRDSRATLFTQQKLIWFQLARLLSSRAIQNLDPQATPVCVCVCWSMLQRPSPAVSSCASASSASVCAPEGFLLQPSLSSQSISSAPPIHTAVDRCWSSQHHRATVWAAFEIRVPVVEEWWEG